MSTLAVTAPAGRRFGIGAIVLIIVGLFVLLTLAAIAFGSTWIPLETVANVILGGGERTEKLVVWQLRMPRVMAAAIAGAAISFSGYLLQRITRNELASPGVLGVVDGAALGVVLFLAIFSNESNALTVSVAWQPLAAAIGALTAISLVFILSGRQSSSAIRLLLFGIAIAAVAKALTTVFMLIGPIYQASQAARWLAGAVNAISWSEIQIMVLCLVPTVLVAFWLAKDLPPADLDDVSSRSIGLNLPVYRIAVFFRCGGADLDCRGLCGRRRFSGTDRAASGAAAGGTITLCRDCRVVPHRGDDADRG